MEKVFLNRLVFPVRWVDLDMYWHVNNSKFFDAMTEARGQFFQIFIYEQAPVQFYLVDTHCNFRRPFNYPSTMVVDQYLTELRPRSFQLYYYFTESEDETICYAEGDAKLVCFDPVKKRATVIPEDLKIKLSGG